MKMSLCNTFSLTVVSFIFVSSSIGAPTVAFTLRRTSVYNDSSPDLAVEESVVLESTTDLLRQTDTQLILDKTNNSTKNFKHFVPTEAVQNYKTENDVSDKNIGVTSTETIIVQETTVDEIGTESSVPATNEELQSITTNSISDDDTTTYVPFDFNKRTKIDTTTKFITLNIETQNLYMPTELGTTNISTLNVTNSDASQDSIDKIKQKLTQSEMIHDTNIDNTNDQKPVLTSYKLRPMPKWKKYTTIERKRISLSPDEKINKSHKYEEIINAESKNLRVTLQDTVTSDIPSLEQLKNDLITSSLKLQKLEGPSNLNLKSIIIKDSSTSAPFDVTPSMSSSQVISPVATVESIRAGFLNYSGKTTTVEVTTEKETSDFKINNDETLRSMFETENPDIVSEFKTGSKIESQSILNEDAIKEELLKEELINDNENAQRQREDYDNNNGGQLAVKNINHDNSTQLNTFLDDNLSVKPISADKSKNTTLYAVNPNYKPMKKIEVLPPKQFVRDPDDNTWRNESLSSLGIVFKPKNSSKPFTQVLRNKTEIEWNNLSDKDSKNDLPDLRERLQKMAEKRKSKRKKIDSFGNIVYFDYEENSNSAESNPLDKPSTNVTTSSPDYQVRSSAAEEPQDVTSNTPSTSQATTESGKQKMYTTKKPKKFLNIPEYYDTTDEDDTDYINMAKIDLQKFTTSLRPSSPYLPSTTVAKQPEWLVSKKPPSNLMSERKATVQYFPPLTTQKVNINDYDNDFKMRVESFTTETELPKHVLPASVDRSTTTASEYKNQYDNIRKDIESKYAITNKSDFIKDFMLTQQPITTDPGFVTVNSDGSYDRGTYVMKHYKDFINEAAKDSEYDKSIDYIPYTEVPMEGITKTDVIGYEKDKNRISLDNAYDYDAQFRKDVLQRFVDNFNQNSDKYKSNFPVLFNSSIIHRETPNGRDIASSRAFMRGLYSGDVLKPKIASHKKPCEPNCEHIMVELSPAYELHYYVPEQEEKEEVVPQPITLPYQYRL